MKGIPFDRIHLAVFVAGMAAASAFFAFDKWIPDANANANQYSCIRSNLKAGGMTGNIPEPEFTITYDVPDCYDKAGYTIEKLYMYGDQVAVHYVKKAK